MSGKYEKYIIREPIYKRKTTVVHVCGEADCVGQVLPGFPAEMTGYLIKEAFTVPDPHAHDFDQLLCFLGGDPENFFDFQAEVEITLGEEQEKYLITSTAIVWVPKGVMHCPIEVRNVRKPILFMHISLSPRITWSAGDPAAKMPHSAAFPKYTPEEVAALKASR